MGPPEGKWIFLTQPDEIREMFTAPADVLHPGEGARVLERDRRLALGAVARRPRAPVPPAQADAPRLPRRAHARARELMQDVAERHIAALAAGRALRLLERTQAISLEVILHAVFGLAAGPQLAELRMTLEQLLDPSALPGSPAAAGPPRPRPRGGALHRRAGARGPADPRAGRRRRRAGPAREDVLWLLLAARDEDGRP